MPTDAPAPAPELWSTPKFFLIALVVELVTMFVLNGVLNMILHLDISAGTLSVGPSVALLFLLPRWRWFAEQMARRKAS